MFRAHIRQEPLGRHVDLYLVEEVTDGSGRVIVYGPRAHHRPVEPGDAASPGDLEPTLRLPEHALPALLGSLSAHLGAVEHPQQLRRDYDAERARVDKLIDLATRPPLVVNGAGSL